MRSLTVSLVTWEATLHLLKDLVGAVYDTQAVQWVLRRLHDFTILLGVIGMESGRKERFVVTHSELVQVDQWERSRIGQNLRMGTLSLEWQGKIVGKLKQKHKWLQITDKSAPPRTKASMNKSFCDRHYSLDAKSGMGCLQPITEEEEAEKLLSNSKSQIPSILLIGVKFRRRLEWLLLLIHRPSQKCCVTKVHRLNSQSWGTSQLIILDSS